MHYHHVRDRKDSQEHTHVIRSFEVDHLLTHRVRDRILDLILDDRREHQ
jgi:hypothetical protein